MKRLKYLSFLILLTLFLVACGDAGTSATDNDPIDTPTPGTQPTSISALMAIGKFQEYPLPQANSGMMRPAIDREGRIWFGEMNRNYLAVFDPHTQQFRQMTPPGGRSGIMGVVVAPDDTVWFAEQYADYIGHYLPMTGRYQTYPLPTLTVPDPGDASKKLELPSAPNDLALDAHGNVWFTELNADALGKLDILTGVVQQYPISAKKSTQKLDPYGVAIDHQGMVWFTEASSAHIGRLDPDTGSVRFFTMHGLNASLMEIVSDPYGLIWATGFTSGLLLRLDPSSAAFTAYYAPFTGNGTGGIYGITVTPAGEIWAVITAENVIARLDVASNHFIYYHIPTEGSLPLGIVMGANHTFWFTEAGSNKIGMLQV